MTLNYIINEVKKCFRYKEKIVLNWFFISIMIATEFSVFIGLLNNHSENLLSYLLVSSVLSSCLLTYRLPQFVNLIRKGEIAKYYLFPHDIWKTIIVEDFSESFALFLENIIFIFVVFFLNTFSVNYFMFIFSLFLSLILGVLVGECFYSLSFPLNNHSASKALLTGICSILSGSVIPLKYLPSSFVDLCYYTPFALLVDGPIQVLLYGRIDIIIFQLIWCGILSIISYLLITNFSMRNEIYGG